MDSTARSAVIVGIVFILGVVLLIGISMSARQTSLIRGGYPLYATFDEVRGLEKGSMVMIAGVEVGQITDLAIVPDKGRVKLSMIISSEVKIPADSVARIAAQSLLGQNYINITYGTPEGPFLTAEDEMATKEAVDVSRMIDLIGETSRDVRELVTSFNENQNKVFGEVHEILSENRQHLKEATEALAKAAPKVEKTFEVIDEIAVALKEGEGTLGKMLKDDTFYNDASAVASNLRTLSDDITAGKGTVGKLFEDEALYTNAQDMIEDIKTAAHNVSAFFTENRERIDELISALSDFVPNLEETLSNFQEVSTKINEGEGTIGKLINDSELYDNANDTFKRVRESFEESEEQGVMRTLLTILVGAGF